ncbi:MAG: glycosyltransferase family 4 protein [Cyanobacteria bacterium J06632_3]
MGLETKRLLIAIDQADYRAPLADIFMPNRLAVELSERVSPVDMHILTAAYEWSTQLQEVAIFSARSTQLYSEVPYLGVRLMGSGVDESVSEQEQVRLVADFCPTNIVLCTPSLPILRWAVRNKIATVVLLSEWREPLGLRQQWQHRQLVDCLNHSSIQWVGGHGVYACKVLETSGVDPRKLIPWEWPQPQLLAQYPAKQIAVDQEEIRLVYVGPFRPSAGLDTLLDAVDHLINQCNRSVTLELIRDTQGLANPKESQDMARLQAYIHSLGLGDRITFWTTLSAEESLKKVHAAHLLVMPQPAQNLPVVPFCLTLAMSARTPIVTSDHPYFMARLVHGLNAMIFPAGNAKSMAHRIERVMGQPALYAQLSESVDVDLNKVKVPARWSTLINCWLCDRAYDRQHLRNFALSSGRYSLGHLTEVQFTG